LGVSSNPLGVKISIFQITPDLYESSKLHSFVKSKFQETTCKTKIYLSGFNAL